MQTHTEHTYTYRKHTYTYKKINFKKITRFLVKIKFQINKKQCFDLSISFALCGTH